MTDETQGDKLLKKRERTQPFRAHVPTLYKRLNNADIAIEIMAKGRIRAMELSEEELNHVFFDAQIIARRAGAEARIMLDKCLKARR